jgi:hypothetical protein
MRILRLDLGGDIGTIDLHPFISVLHDFGAIQDEALIEAIRSLVSGSGDGIHGLVENAGHLIELDPLSSEAIGPLTTENIIVRIDELATGVTGDSATLTAELDRERRAAQIDAVYVEEIRADLSPAIAAKVQRLRDELDRAANGEHSALEQSIDRIKQHLAATAEIPPMLREIPDEVAELIAVWDSYAAARGAAQPHLDELSQIVQRADGALGRAQADLVDAKAGARPVLLTHAEDERLEELTQPSIERRGRKSKGLTDQEEIELAALLGKVGVPTYTGYAMYRLNPTASPEKMAEVELAEARVVAAQQELDESRSSLEIDQVAADLNTQFDGVKAKAREHLGPMLPSDLGSALAKLVVETDNPAYFDALRELYDLSEAENIPFPDGLEPAQMPEAVANWVVYQETQLKNGPVVDEKQLRTDLEKAEVRLDRHARAMGRIDRLEAKSEGSATRVREIEDQIERMTTGANMSAQGVLEAIAPLIHRIRGENDGSVPVVLAGQFTDLADEEVGVLMDQLEAVAQEHQLIVLTDRRAASSWASAAGLRRALCSTAQSAQDTNGLID